MTGMWDPLGWISHPDVGVFSYHAQLWICWLINTLFTWWVFMDTVSWCNQAWKSDFDWRNICKLRSTNHRLHIRRQAMTSLSQIPSLKNLFAHTWFKCMVRTYIPNLCTAMYLLWLNSVIHDCLKVLSCLCLWDVHLQDSRVFKRLLRQGDFVKSKHNAHEVNLSRITSLSISLTGLITISNDELLTLEKLQSQDSLSQNLNWKWIRHICSILVFWHQMARKSLLTCSTKRFHKAVRFVLRFPSHSLHCNEGL